jgi:hypothetical protein
VDGGEYLMELRLGLQFHSAKHNRLAV